MRVLEVRRLGRQPYERTCALQEALVRQRRAGEIPDTLLLLEHDPVITVGRSAGASRGVSPVHCAGTGTGGTPVLPVVETSRGGQATYHGPGQLIGYPIVHLREWHCDLHWYLRQLEEALISSLAALGLKAGNIPGQTGVWIGGRKIASIGVAVRGWVTYHGFALNVNCEMAGFASISPCGLPADSMIRLKDLGLLVGVEELQPVVAAAFSRTFGYESVRAS